MNESETFAIVPAMDDDREIGSRIRSLRTEVLGISSQTKFARQIGGITRGAVGNWEVGKGIKRENLVKIAERFNVSFDWLATGRGPDPLNGSVRDLTYDSIDDEAGDIVDQDVQGYTRDHWKPNFPGALPELDISAGAGEGTVGNVITLQLDGGAISAHEVVDEWPLPQTWLHEAVNDISQSLVVKVVGESMVPNYLPGDRVVVDLSQDRFMNDSVYLISDGEGAPQIKRLQRVPLSVPTRVTIISDNPAYQNHEVEVDLLRIHGRVCAHVGRR